MTPPGHSVSILTEVIRAHGFALDLAAEAYARLGIAVADAFIACWRTKFHYNLLRPVTYIRAVIDAGWTPVLTTPPFPEYTSGHSVQSGAAAQVLTDMLGPLPFIDQTHLPPRAFDSFFEAAEEAAISRLYGGIHFRPAIERGLEQGICVGQAVGALDFRG
ncbi:MAG TPA: vanadium-dependent haloperoxidase [Methylomirabilota bacterium]|nr:vanadium-dependent haloperoxidase [Methylomirabilota bacterium]